MVKLNNRTRKSFGFTLVEMIMVIALLAVLAAFSTPFYVSFVRRNDLSIAARAVGLAINNAEIHSQGILLDQAWSVRVQQGSVTVYLGTNYVTRDQAWDITTKIRSNISFTGTTDFTFSRGTGLPTQASSITLRNINNETRTVSVNAKGVVDIQ